jgi:hypothetical protein
VNPVLAQGEIGLDMTSNRFKIGTGTIAWNDLPYALGPKERKTEYLVEVIEETLLKKVSFPRFMNADKRFLKVYKKITMPLIHYTEVNPNEYEFHNSLDNTRMRFVDDEITAATMPMFDGLTLTGPTFSAGNVLKLVYTESDFTTDVNLNTLAKGWNFNTSEPFIGVGSVPMPGQTPSFYNKIIPYKFGITAPASVLQQVVDAIDDINTPSYVFCQYMNPNTLATVDVKMLRPNMLLIEGLKPDQSFLDMGLRLECYELPRTSKRKSTIDANTKYNYVGYWTGNRMRITNTIRFCTGTRRKYSTLGFRFRDINNNYVSQWLPIKVVILRRWKPQEAVGNDCTFVKFIYDL